MPRIAVRDGSAASSMAVLAVVAGALAPAGVAAGGWPDSLLWRALTVASSSVARRRYSSSTLSKLMCFTRIVRPCDDPACAAGRGELAAAPLGPLDAPAPPAMAPLNPEPAPH